MAPIVPQSTNQPDQVLTKGLSNTRRFALGVILVYQLGLWYRFEPEKLFEKGSGQVR